ncbi:hypothetical protein SRHO_G00280260 [Serrasalmus rhombeus]
MTQVFRHEVVALWNMLPGPWPKRIVARRAQMFFPSEFTSGSLSQFHREESRRNKGSSQFLPLRTRPWEPDQAQLRHTLPVCVQEQTRVRA